MNDKKIVDDAENLPWLGRKLLWLDKKKNVDRIVYGLYFACAILFAADFMYKKYVLVAVESIPGFYGLYGFFMAIVLVLCAKVMRVFLMRPEDYYAPNDVESEDYPEDQLERLDNNG